MIDWTKPIETTDGRKCRYMGTYKQCGLQWHVIAVDVGNGNETLWIVMDDGRKNSSEPVSVRNVPEKHEAWLNCVGKAVKTIWPSRDIADKYATPDRTACIRVEWQDGEGLA